MSKSQSSMNIVIPKKRLYNLKEAAEYLGRTHWGMRELVWKGKLPFVKDGGKYYFDLNNLDAFIEKHKMKYS